MKNYEACKVNSFEDTWIKLLPKMFYLFYEEFVMIFKLLNVCEPEGNSKSSQSRLQIYFVVNLSIKPDKILIVHAG